MQFSFIFRKKIFLRKVLLAVGQAFQYNDAKYTKFRLSTDVKVFICIFVFDRV